MVAEELRLLGMVVAAAVGDRMLVDIGPKPEEPDSIIVGRREDRSGYSTPLLYPLLQ